jgi:dephospho-CoA kinase
LGRLYGKQFNSRFFITIKKAYILVRDVPKYKLFYVFGYTIMVTGRFGTSISNFDFRRLPGYNEIQYRRFTKDLTHVPEGPIPERGPTVKAWPGKFVIGLTGNIATGKSVVRRMFEHLGAYGIDADALAHRAMAKGAPGYQPVVTMFGKWLLGPDGQIERAKLGRIVFSDAQALAQLEAILHPLVREAVDVLVRRSKQRVIVLEAIKLLESPLKLNCDRIVVAYAPEEVQLSRLVEKRKLSRALARQRIAVQPPQREKITAADYVIRNDGSYEDTWHQVSVLWQELFPVEEQVTREIPPGDRIIIERARPNDAAEIAAFMNHHQFKNVPVSASDIMATFGEKAFLLLRVGDKLSGMAGWQVENLVSRTDEVHLDPSLSTSDGIRKILDKVERSSRDLQCEVSLLFLPPKLARREDIWRGLGYEARTVQSLGVRAWQEAAQESMPHGTVLLFKQLRKDRVLRPV